MESVFCFGELLLRMSPLPESQWIENACMPVYVGGAELNVAMALANWQVPVTYCTALPKHALADDICATLSERKIDVSPVLFSGNRIGIYYLAQGTDLKGVNVIYDRAHSSFSELQPGTIDWETILENKSWFYFSAISPALTQNTALVCKEALVAATKKGMTVSVDLNHRAKLWQWGKRPVEVMPELVNYCDVIMGNIWSADALLGIPADADIHTKKSKAAYLQHAAETGHKIREQFPRCKQIAQTFRFDYEDDIHYYATLDDSNQFYVSKEYHIATIKDKVGSGDCFMGGLIYGLIHQHQPQPVIDFAAAAAVGKMNETGDSTKQTISEVEQIINSHE